MRPVERPVRPRSELRSAPSPLVTGLALAAAALGLAIMIVCQALPAFSDSRATLAQDWSQLTKPLSRADRSELEGRARGVLRRHPLEAGAVSLLASLRLIEGNTREADLLFRAAWKLDHRDAPTDLWLFKNALDERRFPEAFLHADAILRREPKIRERLFPALLAALDDPAAMGPFVERLRLGPGWRQPFFATSFTGPGQQRAAAVLWAIKDSGGAITKAEVEAYLSALVAARRFEEAFLALILSLPSGEMSAAGGIFDGGFTGADTFAPFGWRLESGSGGSAAIEATGPKDNSLRVDLFNPTPQTLVLQLLVLPPGTYELALRGRASSDEAAGALEWSVFCADTHQVLGTLPVAIQGDDWQALKTSFTIAPSGCSGQMLKLSSRAHDASGRTSLWFDDLVVTRVEPSRP